MILEINLWMNVNPGSITYNGYLNVDYRYKYKFKRMLSGPAFLSELDSRCDEEFSEVIRDLVEKQGTGTQWSWIENSTNFVYGEPGTNSIWVCYNENLVELPIISQTPRSASRAPVLDKKDRGPDIVYRKSFIQKPIVETDVDNTSELDLSALVR